jgi:hypothetical protein
MVYECSQKHPDDATLDLIRRVGVDIASASLREPVRTAYQAAGDLFRKRLSRWPTEHEWRLIGAALETEIRALVEKKAEEMLG